MTTVHQLLQSKDRQILSISPSATVFDALVMMAENQVGALLVMEDDKLCGIFSERDYARNVVLKGRSSRDTPISEIMTPRICLITVTPDHSAEECLSLISDKRIRHLPVMVGERVIGVLSIGDLVRDIIVQQQQTIRQLESYIQN
jgi:CBS domain-containing protein